LLFVGIYDFITNTGYIFEGLSASINNFWWIALTMTITFFSFVFFIRALGLGKASITQAVRSSLIIFTIPVSIILSSLGVITLFSLDPTWLLIKFIGILMIILGIISFALTLVKAYIFIDVKPGYSIEEIMNKIWNIHGVNRVVAISGPHNIVAKIHTRTLVKGYEKIIKKIEEIEGIQSYKWHSVLKEWEDL
jgi:DNA-binding Lrp family transcriptional regulator